MRFEAENGWKKSYVLPEIDKILGNIKEIIIFGSMMVIGTKTP
ncbi:hypothetical protein [Nitrosomonas eutropha]|nr:hypothetical protein [Nitrosomonas eutropha]